MLERISQTVIDGNALERMVELSNTPVLLLTMPFGKYVGKSFKDINREDRPYLEWLWKNVAKDKDADFKHTVDYWMNRRSV